MKGPAGCDFADRQNPAMCVLGPEVAYRSITADNIALCVEVADRASDVCSLRGPFFVIEHAAAVTVIEKTGYMRDLNVEGLCPWLKRLLGGLCEEVEENNAGERPRYPFGDAPLMHT